MIVGGWNDDSMDGLTSVELFNWKTGEQCEMPSGKLGRLTWLNKVYSPLRNSILNKAFFHLFQAKAILSVLLYSKHCRLKKFFEPGLKNQILKAYLA